MNKNFEKKVIWLLFILLIVIGLNGCTYTIKPKISQPDPVVHRLGHRESQDPAHRLHSRLTEAEEAGFKLVTTSKDMARLETSTGELFHWIASSAAVLEVRMEIDDEDRLASLIKERLRRRQFGK